MNPTLVVTEKIYLVIWQKYINKGECMMKIAELGANITEEQQKNYLSTNIL